MTDIIRKNNAFKKVIILIIIYLFLLQLFMYKVVDTSNIYNYRMDYDLMKDRPSNIHVVLETIKRKIDNEKIEDYIFIIGDSVGYSSPGTSEQSIGYYMEKAFDETGNEVAVFNLSLPSNQTGDIYTILLMLDEYGISRENIVVNVIYAGFIDRVPSPPLVFWFTEDIKKLDKETFNHIKNSQIINGKAKEDTIKERYNTFKDSVYNTIAVTKYKDFIVADVMKKLGKYESTWMNETGEPWMSKTFLRDLLNNPVYQEGFTDKPFTMDESNQQLYFLEKIIKLQEEENLIFFMSGVNTELLKIETDKPGYKTNLQTIDKYFEDKNATFLNLYDKINNDYYSDQVHFIPEGYEELANILVNNTTEWFE